MVCDLFGCPPDVAERQDVAKVTAIAEYRAARQAIALFNEGERGLEQLRKAPELVNLLVEMHRAQTGDAWTAGMVYEAMAGRATEGGGDDDG